MTDLGLKSNDRFGIKLKMSSAREMEASLLALIFDVAFAVVAQVKEHF